MTMPEAPLEITVQEAKQLVTQRSAQAEIIDVREPDEFAICHVTGSTHVPMREIPDKFATLPRDKQLLILCHHGGRSMRVTQFLRANGMNNVTNIAGGIDAWAAEIEPGMPRY